MPTSRPTVDISTAGWTNRLGGIVGLAGNVNEAVHDEAKYVRASLPRRPFLAAGALAGEQSRSNWTTAGGTPCTLITAYAHGIVDNFHKLLLIVPNTCDLAQLTPVVFVLHGVGNDETIATTGSVFNNGMTDSWLDLGWPVLSATQGNIPSGANSTWGNDGARDGFLDIWSWLSAAFTCSGFLVYGLSMGGCAGLNYLLDCALNALPVLAMAGVSPVTNFGYTYTNIATLTAAMRSAYGLGAVPTSDPTYIAAVLTDRGGHDPDKVNAAQFPPIPMRFYSGSADSTAPAVQNCTKLTTTLRAGGWTAGSGGQEVNVVSVGGVGHLDASLFQPSDTNAFYQRALLL